MTSQHKTHGYEVLSEKKAGRKVQSIPHSQYSLGEQMESRLGSLEEKLWQM